MGARWTKDEENYLIENYSKLGALACSKYLSRTEKSVFGKGNKLGLKAKGRLKTNEEYVLELQEKDINIVPLDTYIGNNIPILHRCDKNHEFKVQPSSVLNGIGCSKCYTISQSKTHDQYANSITFQVLEIYTNRYTKLKHKCQNDHVFEATPEAILKGGKCPTCYPTKCFDNDKPSILYYLKIMKNNLTYYKIGITNRTVAKRFESESKSTSIKVIQEIHYDKGLDARLEEKRLLEKYKSYRQHIPELLVSGGNTELFEFDVLGLDK